MSSILRRLLPLFLLVLTLQEMMVMLGEAAVCETPSKVFNGVCLSSRNCGAVCEKERFAGGSCKLLKCVCNKDCGGGGGGGVGPPDDGGSDSGGDGGGDGGELGTAR